MEVQVPREHWFFQLHDLIHLRKPYFWKLDTNRMTIGFNNG
jgi:hypothetical protein